MSLMPLGATGGKDLPRLFFVSFLRFVFALLFFRFVFSFVARFAQSFSRRFGFLFSLKFFSNQLQGQALSL